MESPSRRIRFVFSGFCRESSALRKPKEFVVNGTSWNMLNWFFFSWNSFSLSYSNMPYGSNFCGVYCRRARASAPPKKILMEETQRRRFIPVLRRRILFSVGRFCMVLCDTGGEILPQFFYVYLYSA